LCDLLVKRAGELAPKIEPLQQSFNSGYIGAFLLAEKYPEDVAYVNQFFDDWKAAVPDIINGLEAIKTAIAASKEPSDFRLQLIEAQASSWDETRMSKLVRGEDVLYQMIRDGKITSINGFAEILESRKNGKEGIVNHLGPTGFLNFELDFLYHFTRTSKSPLVSGPIEWGGFWPLKRDWMHFQNGDINFD
jgi:hypothetical protein